jgi:hypothetical protein
MLKDTKKFIVLWDNETQSKTFDKLTEAAKHTKELRKQGKEDAYFKHDGVRS